jgi:hypothetical protein
MRVGRRILEELREIGLVTLFFLVCFTIFLSLKKLLLSEYHVPFDMLHVAVIGALIVAKVVVLLEKSSFGNRFRSGVLFVHVLWRSLAYTAVVFVVSLAEHLFDLYRETGALPAAASELWADKDFHHFLAMNLAVGISFLVYNSFSEIDGRLGEGGLRKLFFSRRRTG